MRRLLVLLAVTFTALLGVHSPALANLANQPIIGDLDGDGRLDRATLGRIGIGNPTCTVSVETRKPDGTYLAPVVHSYTSPMTREPRCPNMGVAVDLKGDGETELVTTQFDGFDGPDLLVLSRFQPIARYDGLSMPSAIETVDFNGDGLGDIWQSTDQQRTAHALLSTAQGAIVPGPFSVCSQKAVPQHYFVDFNGDGGQDMLVSRRCDSAGEGPRAEVHFGNGAPKAVLATSPAPYTTNLEVFPIDVDSDGIPDAGVIERRSGGVNVLRHFRNDGAGAFTEVPALTALALPAPYRIPAGTTHR
ncbi:FG-GAP repeat domain-containing protein [Umezawaea sp. NPDC059074]|uniref:FG-GAP repeat domain-containing protein n=1 Tax=Umezawaea sp. NPDC059074 TaxID=3346716 RepID=UPI0036909677